MEFLLAKRRLKVLKVLEDFFPLFQDMDTEVFWQMCPSYCGKPGKRWEVIAAASSDDKLEVCKKATLH